MKWHDIAITVDSAVPPNQIILVNALNQYISADFRFPDPATPEEKIARDVADRLLDRTGPALTLDILQRAYDSISDRLTEPPVRMVMSPATRREYLKLIETDRRVFPA